MTVVVIAGGAFVDLLPQALLLAAELTAVITFVFALVAHRRTGTAKEPVALAGAVVAAVTPLVPLAAAIWPSAFGAEPPDENIAQAVELFVGAAGTIMAAFVLRMFVRAPRT